MLKNRTPGKPWAFIAWSVVAVATIVAFAVTPQDESSPPEVKDFEQRIGKYLDAQKAQNIANKPGDSASQGDIFTSEIGAYFKEQFAATFHGPDGEEVRKSLLRAEPLPNIPLKLNQKYPGELPLQSMPPTLLLNLPRLPHELQYRIAGTTLVLYDVSSDLIADLLPGALPAGT
jgi:hypothetical protein